MKIRLSQLLVKHGLVPTRSQAESQIRLGKVSVNDRVFTKPDFFVSEDAEIRLADEEQYVSRAALKLKSVSEKLKLDFRGKLVLDVGSSTGGFTDFALSRGAQKVVAVDVGTNQLHPKLRKNPRVELHEKTDIRDFYFTLASSQGLLPRDALRFARRHGEAGSLFPVEKDGLETINPSRRRQLPDIILIDVSFISLREILPHIAKNLSNKNTQIVAMVKPQFEVGGKSKNAGVVKNETERRKILKDFELWARRYFLIRDKKDSEVSGATGNRERFYLLKKL